MHRKFADHHKKLFLEDGETRPLLLSGHEKRRMEILEWKTDYYSIRLSASNYLRLTMLPGRTG
jgi:hypothetical protein